jgi:serologically defined colon cancer antigen 8
MNKNQKIKCNVASCKFNNETAKIEAEKKARIAELEEETRSWENKYNNREPRPEDIEKIKKLESLIAERTAAIDKVQSELKRYQAELLNRETTYNKVFNNKPQVAVLSALERKAKRDAIFAAANSKLPPMKDSHDSARK